MSQADPPTGGIQKPRRHRKAQLARAVTKAGLGSIPYVGTALSEAAEVVLPDPEAKDRGRWEGEVTDGMNDLTDRVEVIEERGGKRTVRFTGGAAAAAKYMIENCPDGLGHEYVTVEDIQRADPDLRKKEIEDGLGDLEGYRLVESLSLIGPADRYRLTQLGYEAFDLPIMGWDTKADAREIARRIGTPREGVNVAELDAELGWPRRRLNPALQMVVDFVEPDRVSQEVQAKYVTNHFFPSRAEAAMLRRFADGE